MNLGLGDCQLHAKEGLVKLDVTKKCDSSLKMRLPGFAYRAMASSVERGMTIPCSGCSDCHEFGAGRLPVACQRRASEVGRHRKMRFCPRDDLMSH
ncbi:hypothetical protein SUGI_0655840 [Cryptomeria japonica]|nr:hypothetical protein SUGI_0655840 [Cryptomeria japonica]